MSPEPLTTSAATKAARVGAGWVNTLLRARKHVRRNDLLAVRAYEDAVAWVKGERESQRERLAKADGNFPGDMYYGPSHVRAQAEVRAPSAERWRVRRRQMERTIEDLADQENSVHRLVRWLSKRSWPPANPHAEELDALTANWEHGVQPRTVTPPPESFAALAEHEPGLLDLWERTARFPDPGDTPSFCRNHLWYDKVKPDVVALAGWKARSEELQTPEAYDIVYQTIYEALPLCRDCDEDVLLEILGVPPGFLEP